jgi:SAM-dependent methyltransferase
LDPTLDAVLPHQVRDHFLCGDVRTILAERGLGLFDRIIAMDVLEHFSPEEAHTLLTLLKAHLNPGGRLILKVPNASSPWGLQYQNGDMTHRTAFTPTCVNQLACASGYRMVAAFPVREGSKRRMITDCLVHRFLSWALLTPPPIWTANFVAILET